MLGGALILSGTLAYAAIDATRKHRAAAQSVIQDYVRFATEQFAGRFAQEVEYYGLYPTVQLLAGMAGRLPNPSELLEDADQRLTQSLELAEFFFRYDGRTQTLEVNDAVTPPPDLARLLNTHVDWSEDAHPLGGVEITAGSGTDSMRLFFYMRGSAVESTAVGLEAKLSVLRDYSHAVFSRAQLLPQSVTGELSNDSVITFAFVHRGTDSLWTIRRTRTRLSDEASATTVFPLGNIWPNITVRATLLDDATNILIAGGVPRTRFPLTVALALTTVLLVTATVVQIMRERSLAKLRTEFVSSVSHELRTPLAQIRMFAETLRLGRMRSQQERDRSLTIIDKEARRLTHLVENVLLFSRQGSTTTPGRLTPVPLQVLVQEVLDSYQPLAEARGVTLRTELQRVAARADGPAIKQAVLNLLDNAVKYGPEGQTVSVQVTKTNGEGRITVEDEGPGVPLEDRDAIWKRFERLKRDRQSTTTGAGIGLAVVHQIMEAQGGRCWIEDGTTGARFVLAVPNVVAVPDDPPTYSREGDESSSVSRG